MNLSPVWIGVAAVSFLAMLVFAFGAATGRFARRTTLLQFAVGAFLLALAALLLWTVQL
ncbi:MAG TPA: hypothetical protein VFK36_14790 [Gemmatimonadales bacterium]|nr:hypothetical protein [Gemmatimonadales bacterium]